MTVLGVLIIFAAAVLAVYLVLFIVGVRRKAQRWTDLITSYVRHLLGGAGVALAVSVAVMFALTAYSNSAQGPLALIFLGPLAVFVGGRSEGCAGS
jgi:hypothetical protein